MGGSSSAGRKEREKATQLLQENKNLIDAINLPEAEKMKLALEVPELAGLLQAEQLGESALQDVIADRQAVEGQRSALSQLKELAESGMTEADRASMRQLSRQVGGDEQARQQSILAEMAQRGGGEAGSGQELVARLLSSQGAADRQAQSTDTLIANMADARRQALSQLGSQSSAFRGQDFQEKSSKAQARDTINQFNAMQRAQAQQQNLANRQNIANQGTGIRNQQQMANKNLYQQQFQNELSKAGALTGANRALSNEYSQQAQAASQAAQSKGMGMGSLLGAAGTAIGAAYGGAAGAKIGGAIGTGVGGAFEDGGIKGVDGNQKMVYNDNKSDIMDKIARMQEVLGNEYQNGGVESSQMDSQEVQQLMSMMPQRQPQVAQTAPQMPQNVYQDGGVSPEMSQSELIAKAIEALQARNVAPTEESMTPEMAQKLSEIKQRRSNMEDFARGQEFANGGEADVELMETMPEHGMRYDEALDEGLINKNDNAQEELLDVLRGLKSPEDMEEGRIIDGESYSGDELPDRINSGEMVSTVKMQDRGKEMIEEGANAKAELEGIKSLLRMVGKNK